MKPIDFDGHLSKYIEKWITENRKKYKNMDEMEENIPEVYLRWINAPADWLDGKTPAEFFAAITDSSELVSMLKEYTRSNMAVPDLLLERITELGDSSVEPLMALLNGHEERSLMVTALNLLQEIGTDAPLNICLNIISQSDAQNDLTDVAGELLLGLGGKVIEPVLARMENASKSAKEAFLDVLCNFPGDERIYNYAVDAFKRSFDNRALYASYLGKLGDERAIEVLRPALDLADINYLDYIEIVNAIEALGGEVTEQRDFNGDPYYESLRKMQ